MNKVAILLVVLVVLAHAAFPPMNINAPKVSVSGISAGGAFAIQYHVAYSKSVYGAGVIAGPPYYCAQGEVGYALTYCMADPWFLNLNSMTSAAQEAAALGYVDPLANLNSTKAYLFSGTADTVVVQGVMDFSYQFYSTYISLNSIIYDNKVAAEHSWITNDYVNPCSYLGTPYINNCNIDAAGRILRQILPTTVNPKGVMNPSSIYSFPQIDYLPVGTLTPASISLADHGYAYVPSACLQNSTSGVSCGVHIAFHGCEQNYQTIGDKFIVHSGLNEYAETNNFIVIYPQTSNSQLFPENPNGCFDWWGYTTSLYHTNQGPQMIFTQNILTRIQQQGKK